MDMSIAPEPDTADHPMITLVLSDASGYASASPSLLDYLINSRNMPGVYVSLNKPYVALKRILGPRIDFDMMFVIDGTTKLTGGKSERVDGCLFIENISNLTDIAFILEQALASITGERKFVLIDSLTTLLAYNSEDTVFKFIHYVTGLMRIKGVDGIFLALDQRSDMEFQSRLSMFCDRMVKLDNDIKERK